MASSFSSLALSEKNQLMAVGANLATNTLTNAFSTFSDLRKHEVEHPNGGSTKNTGARAPISIGLFNFAGPTIDNRIVIEHKEEKGITLGQGLAFVGGAAAGITAGVLLYKHLSKNEERQPRRDAHLLFNVPVNEDENEEEPLET